MRHQPSPSSRSRPSLANAAAAALLLASLSLNATAVGVKLGVVHRFSSDYANAVVPTRSTQAGDGRIIFTTQYAKGLGCGDILSVDPDSGKVTQIEIKHKAVGCGPSGLAADGQGGLWGTMTRTGPAGYGSVFRIPSGGQPEVVHAFTQAEGRSGSAVPVPWPDGGARLTRQITAQGFNGQFDRYSPPGFGLDPYLVLDINRDHLSTPRAAVGRGDGYVYSLAYNEDINEKSSLIRVSESGELTVLVKFYPYGAVNDDIVVGHDGFFYMTTRLTNDVDDCGKVLKVDPSGQVQVVHVFVCEHYDHVTAPILAQDGWLYGTATEGPTGTGLIYRLRPDGSGYEVLHKFGHGAAGVVPLALMQAHDGKIYGRTRLGSWANTGAIYRFDPPAP